MEHPDYRGILRRGWAIIVGAIVIGGLTSLVLTLTATPQYTSTATLLFSIRQGSSPTDLNQGAQYMQAQMSSITQLTTSSLVLESVNRDLGLNESQGMLASHLTASVPADTSVLSIAATTTSPRLSQQIASSVAAAVAQQSESQSPTDTKGNTLLRSVQIGSAAIPKAPSSPDFGRNVAAGLLIGLIAGFIIVAIRAGLDRRVRGAEDLSSLTAAPVLATIGRDATAHSGPAIEKSPASDVAESYRRLRLNLDALDALTSHKAIVVTSATPGDGKSTVSLNLALAYVEAGATVLLIDANLRHPGLSSLSPKGAMGLSDVLDGIVTTGSALHDYSATGLHILAAGSTYKNPGGLLASPKLEQVLKSVREDHEMVIVDTADIATAADAVELAKALDGAVVVADLDHAHSPALTSALSALDSAGATVLGVVGNRAAAFHGYSSATVQSGSAPKQTSSANPVAGKATDPTEDQEAPPARPRRG